MARIGVVAFVQGAIGEGMGVTAARQAFRAAGGKIGNDAFGRLWAEVTNTRITGDSEHNFPQHRKPIADEIGRITTRTAVGYRQNVTIYLRTKGGVDVKTRDYQIRTDTLLTRERAIAEAMARFQRSAEAYGEVILGGNYASTQQFIPGELEE